MRNPTAPLPGRSALGPLMTQLIQEKRAAGYGYVPQSDRLNDLDRFLSQEGLTRIEFPQSKTGVSLTLPLIPAVGEAIIDYLRHGRPPTQHREVFLRLHAPFDPLWTQSLWHIVAFYRRRAGVRGPRNGGAGLHSLRHTLATRLLRAGVPLETISQVLGHVSSESTRVYTKVDLDALRGVALDPEEVGHA